ncbi:hypothetical protein K502DRAFT_362534 [Neoconidiobolus thromboides FSU 785]|nr:hypothetical protein K502DRAFT_362534 [Neoconidiobolus thromboides FSU 785]
MVEQGQYELEGGASEDKRIPNEVLLNWEGIKNHNLKSGLPTLEQLFSDKAYPPLTKQNFITFIQERSDYGTLLLIFYQAVLDFETQCINMEQSYPPATLDESQLINATVPFSNRPLIITSGMSMEQQETVLNLKQKSEEIIFDFLNPDSNRSIGVPKQFFLTAKESLNSNDIPWTKIFSLSKQFAFNKLNGNFYTRFIDFCFNSNLTTSSSKLCLLVGLLLLLFGFTFALTLIFLDLRPSALRLVLIPFVLIGLIFLFSTYFNFFPILGIMGKREIAFFVIERIEDINIKKAHFKKGVIHLLISFGLTMVLSLIFVLVPGNHLMRSVK